MPLPLSIAIIPDGARRWARLSGVPLRHSYDLTFSKLLEILLTLKSADVSEAHVYLLSTFNLSRSDDDLLPCIASEIAFLRQLCLRGMLAGVHGNLSVVADRLDLGADYQSIAEQATHSAGELAVHTYVGYSFEWELTTKLERLYRKHGLSDVTSIVQSLARDKIDFLFRSGGSDTLSDFLPIQLRYASLFFTPRLFNELNGADVCNAVEAFKRSRPERRYGR
ncbi:MAG: undecaprenyl diphosphate synthase family protein [Burkholderiales bacterium]|nr:undecaprenyl diphosphate synthase family protein [Burkholderiales bacterium]